MPWQNSQCWSWDQISASWQQLCKAGHCLNCPTRNRLLAQPTSMWASALHSYCWQLHWALFRSLLSEAACLGKPFFSGQVLSFYILPWLTRGKHLNHRWRLHPHNASQNFLHRLHTNVHLSAHEGRPGQEDFSSSACEKYTFYFLTIWLTIQMLNLLRELRLKHKQITLPKVNITISFPSLAIWKTIGGGKWTASFAIQSWPDPTAGQVQVYKNETIDRGLIQLHTCNLQHLRSPSSRCGNIRLPEQHPLCSAIYTEKPISFEHAPCQFYTGEARTSLMQVQESQHPSGRASERWASRPHKGKIPDISILHTDGRILVWMVPGGALH